MATAKGDYKPTKYESPWLFCEGNSDQKHVTQNSTHHRFSHTCSLMACCRSSDCGDGAKDESRKNSEGGGVWSESIGSLSSPHPPPPPYFFPVCDFAPHFTNCPEQASSLATSHIVMSNNIGFLRLLHLDFSFLYGTRFFPAKPIT